jgi:hypothetical protein
LSKPRDNMRPKRPGEEGVSLIMVLVILLFLTTLGGSLASGLAASHRSGLGRLQSAQAFYTAQAGLDWALKNGQGVSIPQTFGGSDFTVDRYWWRYTVTAVGDEAVRKVRGYRAIEYIPGTRGTESKKDVTFWVQNPSIYHLRIRYIVVEWSGPTAYFEKIKIRRDTEDEQDLIWKYSDYSSKRGESEAKYHFPDYFWLLSGESIGVTVEKFVDKRSGNGSQVDMEETPVKITFYDDYDSSYPSFIVRTE